MHLHNNNTVKDEHSSKLKGTMDFREIFSVIKELERRPALSLEINNLEETLESYNFIKECFK